jgi:hypothetical protein
MSKYSAYLLQILLCVRCIAGLILQSLQLKAHIRLANRGWRNFRESAQICLYVYQDIGEV